MAEKNLKPEGLKEALDLFHAQKFAQFHPGEGEAEQILAFLKRMLQNSPDLKGERRNNAGNGH